MSHPSTTNSPDRLLRLKDVERLTGLRKSSIYELQSKGQFVKSVKLSRRAVCWPESQVQAWISERIRAGSAA